MAIPIINSTSSAGDIVLSIFGQIPFFFSGMLFFVGVVIVLAGYMFQERRTGEGSIKAWLALSSFIVSILAIILYLVVGLIDGVTLSISLGLTIVFIIVYLTN